MLIFTPKVERPSPFTAPVWVTAVELGSSSPPWGDVGEINTPKQLKNNNHGPGAKEKA